MVEDGGTLIVGGIYEEDNSDTINKVPLLGDLPVVGNLFKSRAKKKSVANCWFSSLRELWMV